ncbi:hypothetical protein [Paracoccus sp. J39]|uniref:hypothetical protein n=1 Tax=Paracoccus sp. J39 TaxID=935848 RepID=UPI0004B965DF|nr:hypothetical protein [Paracoccus sp. J39]
MNTATVAAPVAAPEAPSLIADQGASATYDAPGVPVIQQGSAIHSSYGYSYGDGYGNGDGYGDGYGDGW